jgi:cell division protein FtsB
MILRGLLRFFWNQRGLFLWAVVMALAALGWAWLKQDVILDYFDKRAQRNRILRDVESLEEDIKRGEREREVLAVGGFEAEKVARERYRLSKPGEKVLYLQTPQKDEDGPSSRTLRREALLESLR